jgi:membrane protein implicated in regulation of membrane protease activity
MCGSFCIILLFVVSLAFLLAGGFLIFSRSLWAGLALTAVGIVVLVVSIVVFYIWYRKGKEVKINIRSVRERLREEIENI